MKNVNPIVHWWVTPQLPPEDIFAHHNPISQWIIHPIKRRLARVYLKLLRKLGKVKVIAITGSTGKTTTTEILASILGLSGKTVWSAEGVDPVYNIPNTILRATPLTKYIILEMSVEYINEMDYYLWLAVPDVGIVTNIAMTHTQYLMTKEGVAGEKGKLIRSLDKEGAAILNAEDGIVSSFTRLTKAKTVLFGGSGRVNATDIRLNDDLTTDFMLSIGSERKSIHINAFGWQFVNNALASAAAADSLGISIESITKGIAHFELPKHRINIIRSKFGTIFDDTYNSNPKAASESLDTFKIVAEGKKTVAVIGDMLELGKFEEEAHRELGRKVGKSGFSRLVGVGNAARFMMEEASREIGDANCFLVCNYMEALEIVKPLLNKDSALFVKGSRSIHLDKLVDALI